MKIIKVPITKVDLWDRNPRNIKTENFKRLKKQIEELGIYKPLICVQENGRYITLGGNMRLRALQEMGIKEIEVSVVKADTEAQRIKYALSDNDRAGEYIEQELAELVYPHIEEINLEDYKVDLGEAVDMKSVIEDYGPDLDDSEDEIPEIDDSPAITKMGDLFTLGRHRLLCGDATKEADVVRLIGGCEKYDLLADPPYNIGFNYEGIDDKLSAQEWQNFCNAWFLLFTPIGCIVTPGPRNQRNYKEPDDIGVWIKRNATAGATFFHLRIAEPILFYGKFNKKRNTDVFDYSSGFTKELKKAQQKSGVLETHPPAKSMKLWCELISMFSQRVIIDCFLGNGTTLIACEKLNRICYGMEIEPKYCDVIITRYCNYTDTPEEEIRATVEHG